MSKETDLTECICERCGQIAEADEGLINTVEMAVDWGMEIPEELYEEYLRIVGKGQQSE